MDVEVYIEEATVEEIMAWIKTCVRITSTHMKEESFKYLTAEHSGVEFPIVLQSEVDNPTSIGVWFNGETTPWESDAECARAAHRFLGVPVTCDPGEEYPAPGLMLRITEEGESIVNLDACLH